LRHSLPLPIPPLCPSLPAQRRYLTFFGLIESALVLSSLLSLRERASRVACPGCLCLADAHEEKKDAACCPLMSRLLATHCVRLLKETGARTGHLLPFVQAFVLGMHESCFILGEKRGLGMVALPIFYSPAPVISIRSSPPCWTLRRSRNRRPDRPSIPSRL
jgi:hypothetical protein